MTHILHRCSCSQPLPRWGDHQLWLGAAPPQRIPHGAGATLVFLATPSKGGWGGFHPSGVSLGGNGDTAAPAGPASARPRASKLSAEAAGEEVGTEPGIMSELEQLQQRDIPAGRQVLRDHHCNLHRVADYCESNYLQVRGTGTSQDELRIWGWA